MSNPNDNPLVFTPRTALPKAEQERMASEEKAAAEAEKKAAESGTPIPGDGTEPKAIEVTPDEKTAGRRGWVPKEAWVEQGKAPEDWISASHFNDRGRMIGNAMRLEREVGDLKKAVGEMGRINEKIAERTREETLKELKAAKSEAYREQDYDAVTELDEEIAAVRAQTRDQAEVIQDDKSGTDPTTGGRAPQTPLEHAFAAWLQDPKEDIDIFQNVHKRATALAEADVLFEADSNISIEDMLEGIRDKVEEVHTPKATTRRKPAAPTVDDAGQRRAGAPAKKGAASKYSASDLNEEQKQVGGTFVSEGLYSNLDDYARVLADIGGLESQQ